MKTWVKLYTEMLNDPKMARLTWSERGLWCSLIALAGQIDDRDANDQPTGALGSKADIAWLLRSGLSELEPMFDNLVSCELLVTDGDQLTVRNYSKRQAIPESSQHDAVTERQRQWYAKHKPNSDLTPLGCEPNSNLTEPEKIREDKKREEEKREDADAEKSAHEETATAAAFTAWQNARGGAVNELDTQIIGSLVDEFTAEWVTEGIKAANAARQDKLPSINFLRAILDRWKREGFKAPFDAKGAKGGASSNGKTWYTKAEETLIKR